MKQKSSIFISRINFTKLKKQQLYKSLLHTLRICLPLNVDEKLSHDNETYINNLKNLYKNNENFFEEYDYLNVEKMLNQIDEFLKLSNEDITEKNITDITEITNIINNGNKKIEEIKKIKLQNAKDKVDVKLFIKRKMEEQQQITKQEQKKLTDQDQKQKEENAKRKFELMINKMIDIFQNDVEDEEKPMTSKELEKLRDSIKTTRNRLKSKGEPFEGGFKDLSLEDYDKSNLTREEFINQNFKRKYNTEEQTKAFMKRTIESLLKYDEIKHKQRTMNKNKVVSGTKTITQELIFKPTLSGFNLSVEELKILQKKIIDEETAKGNFVLLSSIHNDESSPHIHFFISSKTFNILENQINFINSKYGTDFKIGMGKKELQEYGRITQKHYLETINSCIQDNTKEFTLTHLVNKKEKEQLTNEEKTLLEVENINRINHNLIIKTRSKQSISKREYNHIQQQIEENQIKSNQILIKSSKNLEYIEDKKIKYQEQLQLTKKRNEEELDKIRKRMLKEIQEEKEKIKRENQRLKRENENLKLINDKLKNIDLNIIQQNTQQIKELMDYFDKESLLSKSKSYINNLRQSGEIIDQKILDDIKILIQRYSQKDSKTFRSNKETIEEIQRITKQRVEINKDKENEILDISTSKLEIK